MRFVLTPLVFLSLAASLQAAYTPKQWAKEIKAQTSAFKKADKDRDEVLSRDEFLLLLNPKAKIKEVTKRVGPFAQDALATTAQVFFDWFDEDTSGEIDLEEWIVARTADPNGSTPSLFDIPEEVIDRNLNGSVNLKEFQWIVQSYVSPTLTKIWHQRITAAISNYGCEATNTGVSSNVTMTAVGHGTSGVTGALTGTDPSTSNLTKTGSGTLTLGGTNTYTGSTTVNGGSLGGTGSIAGSLNTTGTLAPGSSPGLVGSTFTYEIPSGSPNGEPNHTNATLNLIGLVSTGTSISTFSNASLNGNLFTASGTLNLEGGSLLWNGGNNTWQIISIDDNDTPPTFLGGSLPISTSGTSGTNTVILSVGGTTSPVFQPTSTP